jgi:hypothetical protein
LADNRVIVDDMAADTMRRQMERQRPAAPQGAQRLLRKMAKMQRKRAQRLRTWNGR